LLGPVIDRDRRGQRARVRALGQLLVDACGVASRQRVLDVAAGTGSVAIRAAQAGADVVAADLTPEHFEAGRRAATDVTAISATSLDTATSPATVPRRQTVL
jgi:ubiquinone/menaquinone biosynthesis C-methylase UbiE